AGLRRYPRLLTKDGQGEPTRDGTSGRLGAPLAGPAQTLAPPTVLMAEQISGSPWSIRAVVADKRRPNRRGTPSGPPSGGSHGVAIGSVARRDARLPCPAAGTPLAA